MQGTLLQEKEGPGKKQDKNGGTYRFQKKKGKALGRCCQEKGNPWKKADDNV